MRFSATQVATTLLTSALLLTSAVTQAEDRYRVEVILFAYLDENSAREEHWPLLEQRAEEARLLAEAEREQDASNEASFDLIEADGNSDIADSELSPTAGTPTDNDNSVPSETDAVEPVILLDDRLLEDAAARFIYRPDMHIVWHQAWLETLQDKDLAKGHDVELTYEKENFRVIVSGDLTLHRSRYLHVTPDLTVEQQIFTLPDPVALDTAATDVTTSAEAVASQPLTDTFAANRASIGMASDDTASRDTLVTAAVAEINNTPQWLPLRAADLNTSRRMRSGELHYLDHPLLGVLIQVDRYEEPEARDEAQAQDKSENNATNSTVPAAQP
ncbi:MAG: CsiV family protein [Pseudomonadota bacterium]|nr:CsiV family protein [Pseudomonadota bacterium]